MSRALAFGTAVGDDRRALVFSSACLAAVLVARPLLDAFYESGLVKYLYMLALVGAGWFAWAGRRLGTAPPATPPVSRAYLALWLVLPAYALFLFGLAVAEGGGLETIFKIASPFLLYLAVAPNITRAFAPAIAISAAIVIFANLALVPFDAGYVDWGGVRTFKGYYLFKTDLAFGISTALLALAVHYRFRLNAVLVAALLAGAVQVVISNARLNYLIFGLVAVAVLARAGRGPGRLALQVLTGAGLAAAVWLLYDADQFLTFDASNVQSFTQGRSGIWEVLLVEGFATNTASDWLFGRGLLADLMLHAEHGEGDMVHNAHNEYIWLLLTQGLVGTATYIALWTLVVRDALHGVRERAGWTVAMVLGVLAIQGLTANVSPFASKTWPVVFTLFLIKAAAIGSPQPGRR